MLISDIRHEKHVKEIRGRVVDILKLRNLQIDEEEDEIYDNDDGPICSLDWTQKVLPVKISCFGNNNSNERSEIFVYFYNDWALRFHVLLEEGAVLIIQGSSDIVHKSCVPQHDFCLAIPSNNNNTNSSSSGNVPGLFVKVETSEGLGETISSEIITPSNVREMISPSRRRRSLDATDRLEAGKEVSKRRSKAGKNKNKNSKKNYEYEYKTFAELKDHLIRTKEREIECNIVASIVTFVPQKTSTGTHKYSKTLGLIDPTFPNPSAPVHLNIFLNDLTYLPKVERCGDMIRAHRISARVWNGNLQLVGWPDSHRSSFLIVSRKIDICSGLPMIQTFSLAEQQLLHRQTRRSLQDSKMEIEDEGTESSNNNNNNDNDANDNDDITVEGNNHLTHPGLLQAEYQLNAPSQKTTWTGADAVGPRNDATRFQALYKWTSMILSSKPLQPLDGQNAVQQSTKQVIDQAKSCIMLPLHEQDQSIHVRSCDIVCIVLFHNPDGDGVWIWDGSIDSDFIIDDKVMNQVHGRQHVDEIMSKMHRTLHATETYTFAELPSVATSSSSSSSSIMSRSEQWRAYWTALIGGSSNDETKQTIASNAVQPPAPEADILLDNNVRERVKDTGNTDITKEQAGYPILIRGETSDQKALLNRLNGGHWYRIRNVSLKPQALVTRDTHIVPLSPYMADAKMILQRFKQCKGITSLRTTTISSSSSSSLAHARNRNNNNNNVQRVSQSGIVHLSELVRVKATPAPAKFACRARVVGWYPQNILEMIVYDSITNEYQWCFSVEICDDTDIASVLLFGEHAEYFFGGLKPDAVRSNDHLQTTAITLLESVVQRKDILNVFIVSYVPPPPPMNNDMPFSSQMELDKKLPTKKLMLFQTVLPNL